VERSQCAVHPQQHTLSQNIKKLRSNKPIYELDTMSNSKNDMPSNPRAESQTIHPPLSIAYLAMLVSTSTRSTDRSGENLRSSQSRSSNPETTDRNLRQILEEVSSIIESEISEIKDKVESDKGPRYE
jgi:hypothetical protein